MFSLITAVDIIRQILRPSRSRSKQSPELTGAGILLIGGCAAGAFFGGGDTLGLAITDAVHELNIMLRPLVVRTECGVEGGRCHSTSETVMAPL